MIFPMIAFFFVISIFSSSTRNHASALLSWGSVLISIIVFSFLVCINSATPDYSAYLKYFIHSPDLFKPTFPKYAESTHTEIGYDCLQAFVKIFSESATFFFFLICFISLTFRYRFYTYFCEYIQDIAIVFFAFLSHEFLRKDCIQIRNGIASAIVLYALVYLFNGKRLQFLLFVLFAASFQQTALIALPLLIVHKECTPLFTKFLVVLFIFSIVFSIFFPIKKILEVMHGVGVLPGVIYNYLHWGKYSQSMSFINPQLLKHMSISAYVFFHYKKYTADRKVFFFFQIYLLCTVYYLVFRDFEILAGRFGSLLYGIEPLLLLRIIQLKKKRVFIKRLLLYGFYLCFFALNILTNAVGWQPNFV